MSQFTRFNQLDQTDFTTRQPFVYRRCNGPCNRKLRFDPSDSSLALTIRCSECKCETNWMLVGRGET